jgi:hypothetical protein
MLVRRKWTVGRVERNDVSTSVGQRGNRNKALLLRERREALKERRTHGFRRCNKVNSKEVSNKWVQYRNSKMVVIGSDAVSLYPSMTKLESADEVANAVLESNIKWEGLKVYDNERKPQITK